MADSFQPIDFSKYAELRELWDKHPSNTQGAYARGNYTPKEGEAAQVLKRYGELSQQLSDEVGNQNYTEAMLALGGINREALDITSGATNYEDIFDRRKQFLAQGRSVKEADSIEPYRLAALYMGERQPDLNYVQADRARRYAAQYGTPEQYDYTNQLATQLRSTQPQGMLPLSGMLNFSSTQPFSNTQSLNSASNNTLQRYLSTLETPYYVELIRRLINKQ